MYVTYSVKGKRRACLKIEGTSIRMQSIKFLLSNKIFIEESNNACLSVWPFSHLFK